MFTYCVKCLGLSEGESYRFIQVERKAVQVPELKSAIGSGILTVSQASRIAPVLNSSNSATWIKKATTLTQKEIEREIAKERPEATKPERIKPLTSEKSEGSGREGKESYQSAYLKEGSTKFSR